MIEPEHPDEGLFDEGLFGEGSGREPAEGGELEPAPPGWRRPALIAIAVVTIVAMALIPLYNVMFARSIADNGLEICGLDYCIVEEHLREAGLNLTMSRLANTFLEESEARALAEELTEYLGIGAVGVEVVEDLEGRLGGLYDRDTRSVIIESPARAWTVLHEVAHAVAPGHGAAFQDVVADLAAYLADTGPGDGGSAGT